MRAEQRGKTISLELLVTLLVMQPRVLIIFWAVKAHCWLISNFQPYISLYPAVMSHNHCQANEAARYCSYENLTLCASKQCSHHLVSGIDLTYINEKSDVPWAIASGDPQALLEDATTRSSPLGTWIATRGTRWSFPCFSASASSNFWNTRVLWLAQYSVSPGEAHTGGCAGTERINI